MRRNGKVALFHDLDLVVIIDRRPEEKTVQTLYEQIYGSLGLTNPEHKLFRAGNFVVDIKFLRKNDLIYPDIWFCDLKAASQLLHGEEVRNLIPWGKEDIPLSSGLRILFERVAALLGNFSYSYLNAMKLPQHKKKMLIFECYKIFIEICTALCILVGKYKPKYADRAKTFNEFYQNELPDLAQDLPDLPKKVMLYTNFKLKPNFSKIHDDPIELWFSAREYLGITLRFYLRKYLGIMLSDWKILPNQMKIAARHYYKPFLHSFLHAKLRSSNNAMLDIANILYQIVVNIEYAYVVTKNLGRVYLRPLNRFYISPSLKFFSAGVVLLFSLNRDGTIEMESFRKAVSELSNCIPIKVSAINASEWDTLRKHFLKAYSLCTGYHFIK